MKSHNPDQPNDIQKQTFLKLQGRCAASGAVSHAHPDQRHGTRVTKNDAVGCCRITDWCKEAQKAKFPFHRSGQGLVSSSYELKSKKGRTWLCFLRLSSSFSTNFCTRPSMYSVIRVLSKAGRACRNAGSEKANVTSR